MNYKHGILHFLLSLLVYLGLPILGWGLGDLKGFLSDPARLGLAIFGCLASILGAWQGLVIPERQDRAEKRVARQTVYLVVIQLLGMALLVLLGFCDRRSVAVLPESPVTRLVGLALLVAGGGLMFASVLYLGRLYSAEVTLQKDHRLVTTGLYGVIRHPRYLGLLVLVLGSALVFRSWIGLAADVVLLVTLLWRISDEEKMLQREFGEEWEAYAKRTRRLVPWVW